MKKLIAVFLLVFITAGCDKVTSLTKYSSSNTTTTENEIDTNQNSDIDRSSGSTKKENINKDKNSNANSGTDNSNNDNSGEEKVKDSSSFKAPDISPEDKQAFLEAINNARADTQDCGSHGVYDPAPAIKWSDELYNAAYEHSRDMAINSFVEHYGSATSSDITTTDLGLSRGSKFYERMGHNGYDYTIALENVAGGTSFRNAQKVVDAWLKSSGHCANLMNPSVTEVGMALYKKTNSKYVYYWTQDFGAQH